MQKVLSSTC